MNCRNVKKFVVFLFAFCGFMEEFAAADLFLAGARSFEIEFVTIGDVANPPDGGEDVSLGSVGYTYRIGKYEISREMIDIANEAGGLGITMLDMASIGNSNEPQFPALQVTWLEAARFVNWLNEVSGSPLAYDLDLEQVRPWDVTAPGYDPNNTLRNANARYFLATEDEWYKAAFYDPQRQAYYDYATGSDQAPVSVPLGTEPGTAVFERSIPCSAPVMQAGGLSPYGTMAQGGNANEWMESRWSDRETDLRHVVRGAACGYDAYRMSRERVPVEPYVEVGGLGFRVASVPEPSGSLFPVLVSVLVFATANRSRRGKSV